MYVDKSLTMVRRQTFILSIVMKVFLASEESCWPSMKGHMSVSSAYFQANIKKGTQCSQG